MSASAGGAAERLRLFFGLPVPPSAVAVLVPWQQKVFAERPGVRAVPGEHLHVTLAFLGSRPRAEVPALREALSATAAGHGPIVLTPTHYRETERVGMLVLDDEGGCAARLQERLAGTLARMGAYRPERRRWLPHLTVARHAARPRLRPPLPELGPFSPSAAALYESVLRRDGAKYRVIEAVTLE